MKNNHVEKIIRLLLGNGGFMLSQWFVLSFLAHTSGPEQVGMFSLAVSIAAPVAILCGLAGRTLLQTDVDSNARPFKEHWHLRLLAMFTFSIILIVTAFVRQDPAPVFWLIIAMIAYKGIENLSDIVYGLAQRNHHVDIMSYSLLWRGIFGLLFFIIGYLLTNSVALAVLCAAVTWGVIFYWHDWRLTKAWHGDLSVWDFKEMRKMALKALPLGIAVFLSGFAMVIPRLTLEHYAGLESLGIFSALAYTLTLGNLMVGSIANAFLTKLTELWSQKRLTEYLKIVGIGSSVIVVCGMVGTYLAYLFGSEILTIIYGDKFAPYGDLFVLVAMTASTIMLGGFWGNVLMGARKFNLSLLDTIITVAISGAASLLLIPSYGIWGAATTLLVFGISKCLMGIAIFVYLYNVDMKEWVMKKNIVISTYTFDPDIGGVAAFAFSLCTALKNAGYEVSVLTNTKQQSTGTIDDEFNVIRCPSVLDMFKAYRKADLILLSNLSIRLGWPVIFFNKKIGLHHHSESAFNIEKTKSFPKLVKILFESVLKRKSIHLMNSEYISGLGYSVNPNITSTIIYPIADLTKVKITDVAHYAKRKDVFFAGRLVKEKGVGFLIDNWKNIQSTLGAGSLIIAGDGDEKQSLIDSAKSKKLKDVVFLGAIPKDDVIKHMEDAAFVIIPSVWEEPFGIVAVQGLSGGAITITSDRGGLPEAVGDVGLTFSFENNSFEQSLLTAKEVRNKICSSEESLTEYEVKVNKHLGQFSPGVIVRELEQTFDLNT